MITFINSNGALVLPNPQYPNTDSVDIKILVSHSMDGAIHTTKYTPNNDTFLIPIRGVTKNKKDQIVDFFNLNSGELLNYTDENGQLYSGYIKIEDVEFSEDSRRYNFDIKFEAV